MKKLSLIIALALLVTIGSVYANWIYNDHTDVADITGSRAVTMTPATFDGGLGTYSVTTAGLTMKIDPKEGTTHTTSLLVDGEIVVTFTPSAYASNDIKNNAVPTKAIFRLPSSLSGVDAWQYDGKNIFTSIDSTPIDLVWSKQADGTFKASVSAEQVASKLVLNEIVLDTKAAYDAYDDALELGQIVVAITDGQSTPTN